MKKLHSKNQSKIVITIIIAIMLCNFVMPKFSYAASTENGGSAIEPISQFLCFIADITNNLLQHMFISPYDIKDGDEYKLFYSPGIIFSGTVPALDIDFIGVKENKTVIVEPLVLNYNSLTIIPEDGSIVYEYGQDGGLISANKTLVRVKLEEINNNYNSIQDAMDSLRDLGEIKKNDGGKISISLGNNVANEYAYTNKMVEKLSSILNGFGIKWDNNSKWEIIDAPDSTLNDENLQTSGKIEKDSPKFAVNQGTGTKLRLKLTNVSYKGETRSIEIEYEFSKKNLNITNSITGEIVGVYSLEGHMGQNTNVIDAKVYNSSSAILQPIIATWYKALRTIALVGLLSALVYIGIRIVTSSSSRDTAKYKKMLKNWFVAVCLLFVLHYLMSLTIIVVDRINSIIGISAIGQNGEDVLMSSLRNRIGQAGSWGVAIAEVTIYNVITVFTIIYTIQYIRRTIYIAFLTMIAPLITLTYPLDKIKDSKAQAFDMWIKDYVFFSLLQVVHLLLYFIFVGQAIDLANRGNWIYAIVAIGFLTQAEKIMRKMFGFEKSKSMGALTAGATGALIMNAINKMSHMPVNIKNKGAQRTGVSNSNGNVRTASSDGLDGLRRIVGGTSVGAGGAAGGAGTGTGTGTAVGARVSGVGSGAGTGTGIGGTASARSSGGIAAGTGSGTGGVVSSAGSAGTAERAVRAKRSRERAEKASRVFRGVRALSGKYIRPGFGKAVGIMGSMAGGAIGFAAGASQGDLGKALTGLAAGGAAGYYGGQRLTNTGFNIVHGATHLNEPIEKVRDVYYEGAEGKEFVQRRKFDREFKNNSEYLRLESENPNFAEESIQKMLNAGISDLKKMDKILKNNAKDPRKFSIEKGIAYTTLAELCPDEILYDNNKLIRFCNNRDIEITPEEVEELRQNIIEFK